MQDDFDYIIETLDTDIYAFKGRTVLLTGSQGFLGRLYQGFFHRLNRHFATFGMGPVKVICVDNLMSGSTFKDTHDEFTYLAWDITKDPTGFAAIALATNPPDILINAAGLAAPGVYVSRFAQTMSVSSDGTTKMLEMCRDLKIEKALFFSSSEIYGDPDDEDVPTPESYVGRIATNTKRSIYDIGKLAVTSLCHFAREDWGVNAQVVIPFNILGYCVNDQRVVPNSVAKLLRGEKLPVFKPGTQTRTFCWFSDFVVASIKVLLHGDGKPYNAGNPDNEISMVDLAHKLEEIAGVRDRVELVDPTAVYFTEPKRRCPNIDRAPRYPSMRHWPSFGNGLRIIIQKDD